MDFRLWWNRRPGSEEIRLSLLALSTLWRSLSSPLLLAGIWALRFHPDPHRFPGFSVTSRHILDPSAIWPIPSSTLIIVLIRLDDNFGSKSNANGHFRPVQSFIHNITGRPMILINSWSQHQRQWTQALEAAMEANCERAWSSPSFYSFNSGIHPNSLDYLPNPPYPLRSRSDQGTIGIRHCLYHFWSCILPEFWLTSFLHASRAYHSSIIKIKMLKKIMFGSFQSSNDEYAVGVGPRAPISSFRAGARSMTRNAFKPLKSGLLKNR